LTAGEPIIEKGKVMGSISASTLLDNEYAENLKRSFFKDDTEILFYSNEMGLVGTSFDLNNRELKEKQVKQFLNDYFNTPSNTLVNKGLHTYVNIDGDKYYVSKIDFPGITTSPGSIFLLIPHKDNALIILFSLIFSFGFLISHIIYYHTKRKIWMPRKKNTKKHTLILLLLTLSIFIISHVLIIYKFNKKFVNIKQPYYTIYNSVLKVEPQAMTLDRNFQSIVSIIVEPGGEEINAISANIKYNPEIVEIVDIIKENSICRTDMFIEKNINNESGELNIACIMPNFSTGIKKGLVAKLVLQPKKEGSFMLDFTEDSQVLANDGLGTDVLRTAIGGFYIVENFLKESTGIDRLIVSSATHPNSNKWYNSDEILFSIKNLKNITYLYSIDKNPLSEPSLDDKISDKDYIKFKTKEDGIQYLHVRPIKGDELGPTSHFRVMIDTVPPSFIEKRASETSINTNDVVRFVFGAQDATSGIQSYYIKIDNGLFLPVVSPIYVPFTDSGNHRIDIRSFDNANNFTDEVIYIKVQNTSWISNVFHIDLSNFFK
jgi:hypothetical protein